MDTDSDEYMDVAEDEDGSDIRKDEQATDSIERMRSPSKRASRSTP